MIVTRIEEISKSKVRVTLDSEFSLVIYKGELKKYHITENEEFPQNQYELLLTVLEKRAKLRCMNLLKSRDYTVYQLKTKLKENGYPEFLIDTAIEYVASYGYVDDERYTRAYIESVSGTKSRNQIMNDRSLMTLLRQAWQVSLLVEMYFTYTIWWTLYLRRQRQPERMQLLILKQEKKTRRL